MSSFRTNRLGQATKKTGFSEFSSFMISAPPARNPVTRRVKRANVANPSQVPQHIVSQSVPNMTSREQGFAVLQPSPDVVDQNSNVHNLSLGQRSFSQRSASSHTLIAAKQQTSIDQQPNLDQQNQPPNLQQLLITPQNNLPIQQQQQQQLGSQSNVSGLCYKQSAQVMDDHASDSASYDEENLWFLSQMAPKFKQLYNKNRKRFESGPSCMQPQVPGKQQSLTNSIATNPSQIPQHIASQSVPNIASREQGSAALQPSPDAVDQNSNLHNVSLGQQSLSQRLSSPHTQIAANQQTSTDQQPNLDQQNQPPNLQQLTTRQNNLPIAQQQQLGSQSNVSGLCYKQSAQVMPQSKVSLQQRPQQAGATMIASQSQQFQLTKHPLHGVSGSLQKVVEQQNQSDRPLTEPASGFTDPTLHANGGDWQEEVYQKIQSIKARHLPALHQIHRNVVAWLEKTATLTTQPYEDQTEKVRRLDTKLQCYINLLKCSKSDISPGLKEKWPLYEKYILGCVTSYGTRKPMPSHHNSMARLQNTSVSPRTRPNTISLKGNAATSSGSLQTNSGSRNNNSMSSEIAVDMLHPSVKSHMAHSSMVPHQHQKKELEQKSVRCHFSLVTAATSSFKRQKIEVTVPLLKEIKEINRQLYDTIVDVVDEITDPSAIAVSSKGTFVTFSTFPVTLSPRLKSHFSAHGLQIQPLLLLVPSSYPNCSPILIDDVSADISNKVEDLGSKARTRFKLTLPTLSKPKSLKEIARIWEGCVRAVISEYAKQLGDSLLHLPG